MFEKICTNPQCIHNGRPQPVENFKPRVNAEKGRRNWCQDCHQDKSRASFSSGSMEGFYRRLARKASKRP